MGTGPLLSIDDLSVGTNKITLTATNSAGQSANAMITVIVEDDLTLPGPTLSVGPTQIGWHVSVGSTQQQNAQISISNAGDGVLTWSASENAPTYIEYNEWYRSNHADAYSRSSRVA